MKKKVEFLNIKNKKMDEYRKELLNKVKLPNKFPVPIPLDYSTFDKINLKKDKVKKKNGFGSEPKIAMSEYEKWKKKIDLYNKNLDENKKFDLKNDPTPAPNKYSLISHWPGKSSKKKLNISKSYNYWNKISKAPVKSIYHIKI